MTRISLQSGGDWDAEADDDDEDADNENLDEVDAGEDDDEEDDDIDVENVDIEDMQSSGEEDIIEISDDDLVDLTTDKEPQESTWFVDVEGNRSILDTSQGQKLLASTNEPEAGDSTDRGKLRKRKRRFVGGEATSVYEMEDGECESSSASPSESSVGDANRSRNSDKLVSRSVRTMVSTGTPLEEDLVVQFQGDSSLCVVASSSSAQKQDPQALRGSQLSDAASQRPSSLAKWSNKSLQVMDMDFNNVFDADQLGKRTISAVGRTASTDSSDPNKRQNLLRDLVPHLKVRKSIFNKKNYWKELNEFHSQSMDWVRSLEFRSKAKVPIINFTHKNGLQCDLSVGISAQDTSEVVRKIKDICGPSFAPLAAFLKVLQIACTPYFAI